MEQDWLTIEVTEKGNKVLRKCAKEAEGEVIIPEGVIEIGESAFEGCDKITSLVIPEGLNIIHGAAFNDIMGNPYCRSLASIRFPSNLLIIGKGMFNEPFEGTKWFECQPDGVLYAGVNAIGYKGEMPEGTEIVIREGTKYISPIAFDHGTECRYNIVKVTLPKSLQYIGKNAFRFCKNLVAVLCSDMDQVNVDNEASLDMDEEQKISSLAFSCCEKLKVVHVPSAITTIKADAFDECKNLNILHFPNNSSLKTIENSHYLDCYDTKKCIQIPQLVFEGGFPKEERLFANRSFDKLYVNDKSILKSFPQTNHTFEGCYINELWINLARKNCKYEDIPEDIIKALHLNDRNRGRIIFAAPELCEEVSAIPGYIRVTKALDDIVECAEHDGDIIDINTKYIISVEPVDIERYHPVKGSIIRCASNAHERAVDYRVYEPCEMVLQKIDASLRMLGK